MLRQCLTSESHENNNQNYPWCRHKQPLHQWDKVFILILLLDILLKVEDAIHGEQADNVLKEQLQ